MEEEKQDKGFKVSDRRIFSPEGPKEEPAPSEEKKAEEGRPSDQEKGKMEEVEDREIPLPEINFATFIFSLSHSAILHLGEIPDPITQEVERNLPLAKQTIDIIGMLKEKTRGNLTQEEQALIDGILYDLRMRYVKEVSK